ncbi:MAG: serine/threonine-protein kinase [Elusimicrobia bacterium]|nr:serine/threonine-protein kinase [Elusimicrobiota bacterium]
MTAWCLALGLTAFAAPVAAPAPQPGTPAAQPAPKTTAEYIEVLQKIRVETDPFLQQLKAFQEHYQEAGAISRLAPWRDVKRLASEREPLRHEIDRRVARFSDLFEAYMDRQQAESTARGYQALKQFIGERAVPQDAVQLINEITAQNNFSRDARAWRDGAWVAMKGEDDAFKLASDNAGKQEVLMIVAVVLCLVLAAVVGLWFRTARAKDKLQTDITKLATATATATAAGAVSLGVSTQGPGTGSTPVTAVLGGNYRVERELGRGGMGIVYEATDLSLRRKVAIKQLRRELQEQMQELEVLLNEARLVAKLKHPNIVEIHSIFKEKGQVYLVFEYVAGRDLHEALVQFARIPFPHARNLTRQIGTALDYAHSERVIHRDLKPSNIIVTDAGVVKVMDFAVAHQAKATVARMTQSQPWGTPPYMAPEQELGRVSRESDLYSLGVCLYEIVTGVLPFSGPNFLAQKNGLLYAPASKLEPSLPPGFDDLMRRALAADPAGRFHSAAEMLAALDALG